MKKQMIKLITLVTFFAISIGARAQGEKTWSFGPEIGFNATKFGNDAPDNDTKVGLLAGAFATYSIVNTFGITGKVLYSQKGAEFNGNKTNLNYIEIPVIGRFFLVKEGAFRPNLFVGPSFGFLAGASSKVGDGDWVKIDDYKSSFNGFDFGVTGGIGLNYEIATETRLLLDARYTHGLSDVSVANGDVNNLAYAITVGVSFGIH